MLVADDHAAMRALVGHVLRRTLRCTVLEAENGERALELARAHRPTLTILDLRMPRLSGPEVLAALRADPDTAGLPVLVMTSDDNHDGADLLAAGAVAFLRKPLTRDALAALLEQLGIARQH
jgi:CheY-like chemotaxis protein